MLEIERKFLLRGLPELPEHADAFRIEQGYLPEDGGRVRRSVGPDRSVVCTFTVKRGSGLIRSENERTIDETEFDRLWGLTTGRRLYKVRYRCPHADLVWEIDAYENLELVLAEVELLAPDTPAKPPPWLEPHVVREVTDEPQYTNYELALKLSRQS